MTQHVGEEWSRTLTTAARPTAPVAAACTAWGAGAAGDARTSEPARWDGPQPLPCRRCPLHPAPCQQTHRYCWCLVFLRQPQPLPPAPPVRCPVAPGPLLPAWPGRPLGAVGSARCPGPGRLPRRNCPGRLVLQLPWPPGVPSASWLRPHRPADQPGSCSEARQTATAAVRLRAPADSFRRVVPPATLLVRRAPHGRMPSRLRLPPPGR